MRGVRSFLALLAVAAGLGAYIYFVESKRPPSGGPEEKPKVWSGLESDKIEEIAVAVQSGDRTTLRKASDQWQIIEPIQAAADSSEASSLASNLASLEVQRVVDDNPSDLKEFGLDPPRVDLTFKTAGSNDRKRLLVGGKTPTAGELYAKLPSEKRVFLIPGYLETTFSRSTFDLRDKTALKFDRDKADALEVSAGGRALRARKEGSDWKLVDPWAAAADFGAVEGLLGRLGSAQMKSIVAPGPTPPSAAELKKYGLDKPAASVRIGAGSSQATLVVGAKAESGDFYARDLSRPAVFTIEASLLEEIKKEPGDFRRKDLFEFRAFNATRVDIARNGQQAVYEKVKTSDTKEPTTHKWVQVAPARKDVDQAKVESMLSAFSNLRAQSFVERKAAPPLDKPDLTVAVRFDDGKKEERVVFVKRGDDAFAARGDEPGAAKVAKADYEGAIKALDELK